MTMNRHRRSLPAVLAFIMLVLSGCTGFGPRMVVQDRFDYNAAIGDSWKQQMLINTVKVRYGDTPVFLDVASVISQYQLASQVNVGFTFVHPVVQAGTNAQSMGANAQYIDRPTITYTPLSGEKFARSLMKPLPPSAVLSLVQAGYPIDLVFRVCVQTVNGLNNGWGGPVRSYAPDTEFFELVQLLRRIQDSGVIGMRVQKTNEMEAVLMSFRGKTDASVHRDILSARKLLGIDPAATEYKIAYGAIAKDNKEIALLSRSILQIMIELSSYIEVPAVHVAEKRVKPTMAAAVVDGKPIPPLIRIQSSPDRPDNSFIAVPYRDHWFWIDDKDIQSKTLFTFLMFIFSLTETGGKEGAPIITVPAG